MSKVEGGKIPARQLMALLLVSRVVPLTIAYPLITELKEPTDAWIGALVGTIVSVPAVLWIVHLGLKFPNKTIVEYSEILLGKFLGKLVGLVLLWYWLGIAAHVAREVGEAYTVAIMPETPILVFMITMAFLGANAARNGLELVGRVGEAMMWLVLISTVIILVLPYDVMRFANLTPVLAQGFRPVLRPAGAAVSFFLQFIVLGMVLPYLNKPQDAARFSVYAVLISGLLMTWLTVVLIAVFGRAAPAQTLPAFILARMISLAGFLERIEAIMMAAWTLSAAVKLALFLWATAVGAAQVFGLKRFQSLVYPLSAIAVAFGVLFFESNQDMHIFLHFKNWGIYSITLTLGITSVLHLAALVRGKTSSREVR